MRAETRNSAILIFGTGVTAVLGLAYSVYAGRELGSAEYSVFATVVSLVFWCQVALGPINGTVARFSAEYIGAGQPGKIRTLAREVARRVGVYGLLGLAGGAVLVKPVAAFLQFDSVWPLVVAFGMVYLTLLVAVARGVLRGTQDFGQYNVNIITESAVRLVVGVVLLRVIWGATSGLTAYLAGLLVTLGVATVQLRRTWRGHEAIPLDGSAIRRFTGPMFILMFTSAAYQNIDMLCVKHYFLPEHAGVYGAAFVLARALGTLVTPFTTLMLPLLTTMHAKGQVLFGTFARICAYFLLLAAGPMLLFLLWPQRIMVVLFDEEYAAGSTLLFGLAGVRLIGYLSHMIALAGAATNRFGSLYVYVPGLLIQAAALYRWHDSPPTIIRAMLVVHCVVFVALGLFTVCRSRRAAGSG